MSAAFTHRLDMSIHAAAHPHASHVLTDNVDGISTAFA